MDNGSKTLIKILAAALALGALVVALHPGYRQTAQSLLKGEADASPVWKSNADYYPAVAAPHK